MKNHAPVVADDKLHPLDNPVWSSLIGPHRRFGRRLLGVSRYTDGTTPYVAFAATPDVEDWRNLARLVGPNTEVSIMDMAVTPSGGWQTLVTKAGVQMIAGQDGAMPVDSAADVLRLGSGDVPDMIDLANRARPGPFLPRTIELGTYFGIRRQRRLVAMAGERLHPPGWSEISMVCTDEAWRGQGFATRLVRALEAEIRKRGETPFLHVPVAKQGTVRLYEKLGFKIRRTVSFAIVRLPL